MPNPDGPPCHWPRCARRRELGQSGCVASCKCRCHVKTINVSPRARAEVLRGVVRNSGVQFVRPSGHKAFHLSLNDTWYCIDCTRAKDWEDVLWFGAHPNEEPKR